MAVRSGKYNARSFAGQLRRHVDAVVFRLAFLCPIYNLRILGIQDAD